MDDCGCMSDKECVMQLGTDAKCVQANPACGCPTSTSACLATGPKLNQV